MIYESSASLITLSESRSHLSLTSKRCDVASPRASTRQSTSSAAARALAVVLQDGLVRRGACHLARLGWSLISPDTTAKQYLVCESGDQWVDNASARDISLDTRVGRHIVMLSAPVVDAVVAMSTGKVPDRVTVSRVHLPTRIRILTRVASESFHVPLMMRWMAVVPRITAASDAVVAGVAEAYHRRRDVFAWRYDDLAVEAAVLGYGEDARAAIETYERELLTLGDALGDGATGALAEFVREWRVDARAAVDEVAGVRTGFVTKFSQPAGTSGRGVKI